jgi:hypothetical protein
MASSVNTTVLSGIYMILFLQYNLYNPPLSVSHLLFYVYLLICFFACAPALVKQSYFSEARNLKASGSSDHVPAATVLKILSKL